MFHFINLKPIYLINIFLKIKCKELFINYLKYYCTFNLITKILFINKIYKL